MRDRRAWLSIAILAILTEAVYFRPAVWRAGLFGSDYRELHARHLTFARDALFGPAHSLPGWYPRELLGAPFAANLQSFPWIPTRLILLFLDPKFEYLAGVALAALLAAIFAYLFSKRMGLSDLGAIAAGWTFACAGYFASRVAAGHLPLLEAYPALPFLLWLADRAVDPGRARSRIRDLIALAVAAACTALAGHPQLPAYALAAAFLYLLVRGRGRRLWYAASALALGAASSLFAWWPMLLLIRRSTRMLDLAPPSNDVAMEYGRMLALIWPGIDGWPELLERQKVFSGYPNDSYFWDTASYLGLLPLLALLFLLVRALVARRMPARPFVFLTFLGVAAFALSLPAAQPIHHLVHGTFFRSPARLFYLCTLCLAITLGAAVTIFERSAWLNPRARYAILGLCLAAHAVDLGGFARMFVRPAPPDDFPAEFKQIIDADIGSARVAADDPAYYQRYDDAGIFDSILLANPYRALLGLAGFPRNFNQQRVDASAFPIPALQFAGVRFVITSDARDDLECVRASAGENLYRVPQPVPRAAFFDASQVDRVPPDALLDTFLAHPDRERRLIPIGTPVPGSAAEPARAEVSYTRPSSDEIHLNASVSAPGFVNVLESFDPGWSATVDGAPAHVILANGFTMAIPIQPGNRAIRLFYRTPGRRLGWLLSLASAVLFLGLLAIVSKK